MIPPPRSEGLTVGSPVMASNPCRPHGTGRDHLIQHCKPGEDRLGTPGTCRRKIGHHGPRAAERRAEAVCSPEPHSGVPILENTANSISRKAYVFLSIPCFPSI